MNSSRQFYSPAHLRRNTSRALLRSRDRRHVANSQTQQTATPEPTAVSTATAAEVEQSPAAAETDAAQKRLARARALAAIGKLAAAAADLENLRSTSNDESVRDVARILLMAILVEMPDYARAAGLLDEAFRARSAGQAGDAATHSYFAIAGQMVNAVRTHLERYRAFGVNVADASELPPEAASDVEQLRGLLDRVVEQAKALHAEQLKGAGDGSRGLDAAALLEDAATVRMRIARHDQDRAAWQAVVSEARQHLFSSEMRIASISEPPAVRPRPPLRPRRPLRRTVRVAAAREPKSNAATPKASATRGHADGRGRGARRAAAVGRAERAARPSRSARWWGRRGSASRRTIRR